MSGAHTPEIHLYVEEEGVGDRYLYVEALDVNGEPVLLAEPVVLALLMGTGETDAERPVAPERGLPANLSLAVQLEAAREHPQHATWLDPAELAEVEARYHALTGKHEPTIQQLLDMMAERGSSSWRVVVWLASEE